MGSERVGPGAAANRLDRADAAADFLGGIVLFFACVIYL